MFDLSAIESDKNFSPLKPGEKVPVFLTEIIFEENNLDFLFVGTDPENAGTFKPRFWGNSFDVTSDKYKKENADNYVKQIRQIAEAYLSEEEVASIKGSNFPEFVSNLMKVLTPDKFKEVKTFVKVVYKYNSDTMLAIPTFGSFISTDIKPRGLSLSTRKSKEGIPYDRILPLSHYVEAEEPIFNPDSLPFS